MNIASVLFAQLRRDLAVAYRRRGELLQPLLFFVITASMFPLALSPDALFIKAIAPAVLWVAALLSTQLALSRLFADDHADGYLEQLLLSPHPPTLLVSVKVFAHWLTTGAPLLVVAPLLAAMLHLPAAALPALLLSLLLGTPAMSCIGAVGAALTLAARGNTLLALLALPLFVPVLIFGAGAVHVAAGGADPAAQLMLLAALSLLAAALAPLAIVAALRAALN